MKLTRAGAVVASTVIAVSVLSSCSVDDNDASGSQSSSSIKIALSAGLDNLDPQRSANGPDMDVMSEIYDTLLKVDPQSRELKPNLATSYKLINSTTWRFKLRHGVKFTNGEPFNAKAVKYSIERIVDPKTSSTSAVQLATVKKVNIVDKYTVDIVTKKPDSVLPRRMQPVGGTGRVFIVPPKYFKSHSFSQVGNKPIGTGPYMLKKWDKGQSLTLVQNPDYWGEKPDIKKATYTFISENTTRVNALKSGEVDLIERVPVDQADSLNKAKGVHVESSKDGLVHTMLLNMNEAPFNDLKVRKAFAHAVDVDSIVKNLLEGRGRSLGLPMSPKVAQYDKSIKPYSYNPALAKKLLAESSYHGQPIKTKTSAGRYVADKEIYAAMNRQLDKVGFNIKPQTVDWGRLINMMTHGKGGPFYMIGWDFGEGDASKADSFLRSDSQIGMANEPRYDKLASAAEAATNEDTNRKLWYKAEKLVRDQYMVGAVWQADSIYGMSDRVSWNPKFGDNLFLTRMSLK